MARARRRGIADELRVTALPPGISAEAMQIDIDRGVPTIAAKRLRLAACRGQAEASAGRQERGCSRALSLPFSVGVEWAAAHLMGCSTRAAEGRGGG